MPLKPLKKDATQEEINAWIIESSEEFTRVETELSDKTKRETELLEANQKLFLKVTTKVDETQKEDETIENEFKEYVGEKVYNLLNKKDKEKLNEIMNGDDE
jgi:hypothetical protein